MFSTFENMENHLEIVENHRKSGFFAWKTVGIRVEKNTYVDNFVWKNTQMVVRRGFPALLEQTPCTGLICGKDVDKNFLHMEKYVENVTKPRKTVIFCVFGALAERLKGPDLVLTY